MVSTWTIEHDARLTEMHGRPEEPSFRIMAAAMNEEFGTVLTRNSLISRARRIHLPKRTPSNQSTFNKQTAGRKARQPPKPRQRYSNESRRMITIYESREVLELKCAEIEPLNISLMDLEPSDCRWPYGEGQEILFCGHQSHDGFSYCGPHVMLSRRGSTS